jgi:hypothetical protein
MIQLRIKGFNKKPPVNGGIRISVLHVLTSLGKSGQELLR